MTKIEEVTAAIKARREELIERPLARIYTDLALAAVAAMREPSREMWAAGGNATVGKTTVHHDKITGDVWQAMIDAALAEHKPVAMCWNCDGVLTDLSKVEFLGDPEFEARK